MAVNSQTIRNDHEGDGETLSFSYEFVIYAQTDIAVYLDGELQTSGYVVSGVGLDGGGNVVFDEAPGDGVAIGLVSNIAATQETQFTEGDDFPAKVVERALDKVVRIVQQVKGSIGRTLRLSDGDPRTSIAPLPLAADCAGLAAGFDSQGNLVATVPLGTFQGDWATATLYSERDFLRGPDGHLYYVKTDHTSGTFSVDVAAAKLVLILTQPSAAKYQQEFAGDGSETTFTLNAGDPPPGAEFLDLWVDGVIQIPPTDYDVNGADIEFVSAPDNGAVIFARWSTFVAVVLADDSVTASKIADKQVGQAHLADQTAGGVQAFDGDGAAAVIAPGTVGQVLTYPGGNLPPVPANLPTAATVPTGVMSDYVGLTAPSGWILADGRTVGSAGSGGTNRANADTENLYTLLWGAFGNTELPIQDSSGSPSSRGASAAVDFAANKRLPVPDLRGRVVAGLDNMGGTAASRITNGVAAITGTTMGAAGGDQRMQNHNHSYTNYDGAGSSNIGTNPGLTAQAATTGNAGAGGSQNVQPTIMLMKIIKL